ncbi:MAG: hypothetical protein ABI846_03980 [Rudaea sp.]
MGAVAAGAEKANVSWVFNDVVAPAEQAAYESAIKSFNKCLGQHGFKHAWVAYTHETGDTYKYSYVAGSLTWADVDSMRAAGKDCQSTWRNEGNAHLSSETASFLVAQPELSRMPDMKDFKPALINVTYFTLKHGTGSDDAFTDGVKKIVAGADKTKWAGHFIVYKVRGGDKGAPDYILTSPYKNFADYGEGWNPPVWKMLEAANGKADADSVRKQINDAIDDASSHVNSYSPELTYTPAK